MKSILKLFLFCLIILASDSQAQFKKDYIVKLNGDTVYTEIEKMKGELYGTNKKIIIRVDGKKKKIIPDSLISICYNMLEYESATVEFKKLFIQRDVYGDINIYEREVHSSNGTTSSVRTIYYIKRKSDPWDELYRFKTENLTKCTSNVCKPIMDSLLAHKDWSTDMMDLVKIYNQQCAKFNNSK